MAIQLKIKYSKPERIERKYSDDNERLNSIMNLCLAENEASCWKNIVDALRAIEKNIQLRIYKRDTVSPYRLLSLYNYHNNHPVSSLIIRESVDSL